MPRLKGVFVLYPLHNQPSQKKTKKQKIPIWQQRDVNVIENGAKLYV